MNLDLFLTLFIGFASLIVAFAILFIVFETIKEIRKEKTSSNKDSVLDDSKKEENKKTSEVQVLPVKVEDASRKEGDVVFSTICQKTHEEKYALLPSKFKKYYDEIVKYVSSYEGIRIIKNKKYEEYKIGSSRLVRLLIKRGVIFAEFIFSNFEFKNYLNENRVSVKQGSTAIKVLNEEDVKIVKDSIEIAHKTYLDEKQLKKELAKEKNKTKIN